MALLTAVERQKLPIGVRAKHKCDRCRKIINSTLIYATKDGQEACSKSCRDNLDSEIEDNLNKGKNMKFAKRKDEDEDTKKKKKSEDDDEEEETDEDEESDEEEETDEEETDEDSDEDEDEKPKAKRGRPAKKVKKEKEKPAKKDKKSKKSKKDDDEDSDEEDEKPSKKDKKKKKAKKDDDDDETPKRTVKTGTKDNPFREGSSIATAFDKVRKGMTVKDFKKFAKTEGHDFGWYMARFRKEEKRGVKWSFSEDDTDIKITLKHKK